MTPASCTTSSIAGSSTARPWDRLLSRAGCTSYEVDASPDHDFYLLDVRTDSPRPRGAHRSARRRASVAELHRHAAAARRRGPCGLDSASVQSEGASYALHLLAELMRARPHWSFTLFGNRDSVPPQLRHANGGCRRWSEELTGQEFDVVCLCDPLDPQAALTLQDLLLCPRSSPRPSMICCRCASPIRAWLPTPRARTPTCTRCGSQKTLQSLPFARRRTPRRISRPACKSLTNGCASSTARPVPPSPPRPAVIKPCSPSAIPRQTKTPRECFVQSARCDKCLPMI